MGVAAAPQGLGPSAQHGSPSLLTTLRLVQKKTLWSCITGTWAPLPSYARLSRSPIPRLDGVSYWTWSAEILDDSKYGSVDRAIREVVLACLGEAGPPPSHLQALHFLAYRGTTRRIFLSVRAN